jgi:polysaccharide biosynthesis protein PslG
LNRILIGKLLVIFIIGIPLRGAYSRDMPEKKTSSMESPFGVLEFLHWNHAWNNYQYASLEDMRKAAALMQEAGVGWVRMDFLWSDIEPQQGEFDFAKYDAIVSLLREYDINILGLLHYSTDWASGCGKWNCPPRDTSLFVNYATRVIKRYKEHVKHWEVWNEPDSSVYWASQDGLKSYCALLKEVYAAAKNADPECKILNGGLANGLGSVHHLYENGARDYFDILNIHIFQTPLYANSIHAVLAYPRLARKVMERNGDAHKELWITEIGCPGVKRGTRANNWWLGKNPTERQQAEWVKKVYNGLLKQKLAKKIFWAFFRDCRKHWDNGVDYFGLVRWDFSRKPAFKKYKECVRKWKHASF